MPNQTDSSGLPRRAGGALPTTGRPYPIRAASAAALRRLGWIALCVGLLSASGAIGFAQPGRDRTAVKPFGFGFTLPTPPESDDLAAEAAWVRRLEIWAAGRIGRLTQGHVERVRLRRWVSYRRENELGPVGWGLLEATLWPGKRGFLLVNSNDLNAAFYDLESGDEREALHAAAPAHRALQARYARNLAERLILLRWEPGWTDFAAYLRDSTISPPLVSRPEPALGFLEHRADRWILGDAWLSARDETAPRPTESPRVPLTEAEAAELQEQARSAGWRPFEELVPGGELYRLPNVQPLEAEPRAAFELVLLQGAGEKQIVILRSALFLAGTILYSEAEREAVAYFALHWLALASDLSCGHYRSPPLLRKSASPDLRACAEHALALHAELARRLDEDDAGRWLASKPNKQLRLPREEIIGHPYPNPITRAFPPLETEDRNER